MRHRVLTPILTVGLAVGVPASFAGADQAKPRGSSSGSGSSSAGARHHSPSSGSSQSRSSSSGSGSGGDSYRGSPSSRPLSQAERRHPRPGTGTGYRGTGYQPYYYAPGWGYWYNPGYYPGYYYGYSPYWGSSLAFGAGGYWGGGYWGGGYAGPSYSSGHTSDAGAVRVLVDPEDTKVYVDGYYAGEVDEFDGLMQRLNLAAGRHEILLKKDGYRSHRIKLYVERDATIKLRHDMEKGMGPDTLEDLAGDRGLEEERRRAERRPEADEDAELGAPQERELEQDQDLGRAPQLHAPSPEGSVTPGLLILRVTPEDASVYVDGRFFGSARQTGEIELSSGRHRVEIVRPGFRTVERDVVVDAGRTLTLGIALDRP
ncbi:MAG TPA: PEGA domain-containing protein [Vicinamibacteria bacterium]